MTANIDDLAVLDTDHLGKYTLGDHALESEILQLFLEQASLYLKRLEKPASTKDWREAAHSLKGSARGIGAFQVGMRAEQLEKIVEPVQESARCAILVLLQDDLKQTTTAISSHIGTTSSVVYI